MNTRSPTELELALFDSIFADRMSYKTMLTVADGLEELDPELTELLRLYGWHRLGHKVQKRKLLKALRQTSLRLKAFPYRQPAVYLTVYTDTLTATWHIPEHDDWSFSFDKGRWLHTTPQAWDKDPPLRSIPYERKVAALLILIKLYCGGYPVAPCNYTDDLHPFTGKPIIDPD